MVYLFTVKFKSVMKWNTRKLENKKIKSLQFKLIC